MILIVDDEAGLAAILQRLLEYAGYEAIAVTSGAESLTHMRARVPTLLVLDLHMPSMDGFDVLIAMKATGALSEVPVLVYSADDGEAARTKAILLGAADFLVKSGPHFDRLVDRIFELAGPAPETGK